MNCTFYITFNTKFASLNFPPNKLSCSSRARIEESRADCCRAGEDKQVLTAYYELPLNPPPSHTGRERTRLR